MTLRPILFFQLEKTGHFIVVVLVVQRAVPAKPDLRFEEVAPSLLVVKLEVGGVVVEAADGALLVLGVGGI